MNLSDVNLTDIQEKGEPFLGYIQKFSNYFQEKVTELGFKFPNILSSMITIFIGLFFIFIGTKITNKIIKVLLFIIGVIILVGLILTILGTFKN